MFSSELRQGVEALLQTECADNLPFCEHHDPQQMERIRFSVLKLSQGDVDKLLTAIELAQVDWRDLFMAAGFGHDPDAHRDWSP